MSILINKNSRVVTQGITGKTGMFHTQTSRAYANGKACYVAGVNPKKAGENFEGIPIFQNVAEAKKQLHPVGAEFELRVWEALRAIPPGATTSYGAIAKALGSAGASRAVGAANGANPIAIIVPCHRVIGSTGSLTGYGGGLDRKTWLIDHERRWRIEPQASLF